jgi:uncharacterized linocin/CFP29 family protein
MATRESVGWSADIWSSIDQAVHDEVHRSLIATTFVPVTAAASAATTVPADEIDVESMTVAPSAVLPVVELALGFSLTEQQVDNEADLGIGRILATRAANFVAQVEDLLVFRGDGADRPGPLRHVQVRGNAGMGLLAAATQQVDVAAAGAANVYREHTFDAVVSAIAKLRSKGQAGPYALALSSAVYADTFVPVPGLLVMPADQVRPLVTAGFVDAPMLPERRGLVISLGGNTVDLAMAVEPTVAFVQVSDAGMYQFRLNERWALRIKDADAIVRLVFEEPDDIGTLDESAGARRTHRG